MLLQHPALGTKLPVDLTFAYAAYKKGTRKIVEWLTSTASPALSCCSPQGPVSPIAMRSSHSPTWQHTTACGHQSLTIDDMRALADYIISHSITVPEDVLYSFHKTLEARECMTCWYQTAANTADQDATTGHLIFNAVLKSIYKDLSNAGRKKSIAKAVVEKETRRKSSVDVPCDSAHCSDSEVSCSNTFQCLHLEDDEVEVVRENGNKEKGFSKTRIQNEQAQCMIKDDSLERLMCLHVYRTELSQISQYVATSYLEAGKGNIPLAVVATTTRVAYLAAKRVGQSLSQYGVFDPDDLSIRLNDLNADPTCQHEISETACDSGTAVLESLSRIWTVLSQLRRDNFYDARDDQSDTSSTSSKASSVNMRAFHDPHEFFGMNEEGKDPIQAENFSLETMLSIMVEHLRVLKTSVAQGQKHYTCQRIMADLDTFLYDDSEDPAHACHISFGCHLLVVSYKAYLTGARQRPEGWKSTAVNPRLASLQVARTLQEELKSMLERPDAPCGCLRINDFPVLSHLESFYNKLYSWVRTPRFDLLIQSPWISGEHIVENLVFAARYGYKAWHHGYYLGLILHVYNTLLQCGFVKKEDMPVLEDLCELFSNEVFVGCRNAPKPYTAYKRWTGGYLKFTGHHRHTSAANRRGWDMCVKADPSKGGDKSCRAFAPGKVSLFALLSENKGACDMDVLERVITAERKKCSQSIIKRDAARLQEELVSSGGYATYLRRLQVVLQAEFLQTSQPSRALSATSTTTNTSSTTEATMNPSTTSTPTPTPKATNKTPPIAQLNSFLLYRLCIGVLGSISDSTHPPKEHGTLCRCVCEGTLASAETWLGKNKVAKTTEKRTLFPDKESAAVCKEEIMKVFGRLEWEAVVWKI